MKEFIIEQKITPLVNRYEVYEIQNGAKGALISFVEQKRFAFKEEIAFYTDATKQTLAFRVKAEKVMDVHGKFLVTDENGNTIGWAQKVFKASLLRSTWRMAADESHQLTVTEKSKAFALFRRIWSLVPYLGDFPFVFKYHFNFLGSNNELVAEYIKTTRIRDHYKFAVSNEQALQPFDWRLVAAQCVLLDALQDR